MDFTFAALDLSISQDEKQKMLQEVLAADDNLYHQNDFRGCRMLPIYNGGGVLGPRRDGINTAKGIFKYTPAGEVCPTIRKVCEEKIFPFMSPPGRVTILRTKAGEGLHIHLDSTFEEIGTRQHKFRIVLNGNIDKLFFIDKQGNKVYMPSNYDTYSMDGSHPHSIDPGDEEKITLCIGAPWHGEDNDLYIDLIEKSLYNVKISRPDIKDEWLDPQFKYKTLNENTNY